MPLPKDPPTLTRKYSLNSNSSSSSSSNSSNNRSRSRSRSRSRNRNRNRNRNRSHNRNHSRKMVAIKKLRKVENIIFIELDALYNKYNK